MILKGFIRSEDYIDYQMWLNTSPHIPAGMTTIEAFEKFGKKNKDNGLKVQRCIDDFRC